ncbi:hypothetical protein BaRGS_00023838 [Batillaria attramentaria]|uniref:protein O-GlcNAcase n=1 Tax=Batillaria attramentaria TaxID=370345 RepID=A0ABD0KCR0_9CAEN
MSGDFTAGVVEGFYGVPWSADQRKILFSWMQEMSLNTYMYAPKDDYKHRAYWRELYSVEEADNLTTLIESAHEKGVTFVYAISPGLDISFSSAKDVQALKRKLAQVAAFGCQAFAILFDDIDPELSEADQSVFSSSACAQVSVTNEVYEHLGQPKFLFCPTEYCASRALPTVGSSGYLNTIGSKLLPGIDVMWTGCKVISKKISIQTLEDISTVLKRAPVIWDNIHANDYDPRRIFLGPYDGRSPEIIPYIRGVLTNPNCEFEANYIACHTLGQWCKSNPDGVKKDIIASERMSPVAANIKLETESDLGSDDDAPYHMDARYRPRQALQTAMNGWIREMTTQRDPPKRKLPVQAPAVTGVPSVITPSPLTAPLTGLPEVPSALAVTPEIQNAVVNLATVVNESFLQPVSQPINALGSDSLSESDVSDSLSDSGSETEPMECIQSSSIEPVATNLNLLPKLDASDSFMVDEGCDECGKFQTGEPVMSPSLVTIEDVSLLVDLFYLPFEHGTHSLQLLHSLHWLLNNTHALQGSDRDTSEAREWCQKAEEFEKKVQALDALLLRLFVGPNKSVLCDLYAYLWDMKGILAVCLAYIKWLGFSKGYREAFTSGDQEPWVFRGGLQAELQRLLPICTAHDLFLIKSPDWVIQKLHTFRPYQTQDKSAVYDVCLKTCDDGMDGTEAFLEFPSLIGDRLAGNFLTLSSDHCFVVEDEEGVFGYALAAIDAKDLAAKSNETWLLDMQQKYPKPTNKQLKPAEEVMVTFHDESLEVKEEIHRCYPSVLRLDVLPNRMCDSAVPRRLLACALCALKGAGSRGVHTKLNSSDKYMIDFYAKLGFFPIATTEAPSLDVVYMGRLI